MRSEPAAAPEEPAATAPTEPAPAPVQAPKPFLLPLVLTVRDARMTARHVELDCVLTDAEDRSVQFLPLQMDCRTTGAELEAILQATIDQIAAAMLKRADAALPPMVPPSDLDLKSFVTRTFRGSVAR
jgi:hypothetical protein